MTNEEAVKACEFWTTNEAETIAIGTTRNPMVGLHFDGEEYRIEAITNPEKRGWSITVSRWIPAKDAHLGRIENLLYQMIVAEINRRVSA